MCVGVWKKNLPFTQVQGRDRRFFWALVSQWNNRNSWIRVLLLSLWWNINHLLQSSSSEKPGFLLPGKPGPNCQQWLSRGSHFLSLNAPLLNVCVCVCHLTGTTISSFLRMISAFYNKQFNDDKYWGQWVFPSISEVTMCSHMILLTYIDC